MIETESLARIAILAPMRSEFSPLVRALSLRRLGSGDPNLLWAVLGRAEIVATVTGIGTAAAAQAAEGILSSGPISHLVVVGIAGGIGPSVDIGSLVVPEVVIDLSTGAKFHPTLLGIGSPRGTLVTSDKLLTDRLQAVRLEDQGVIAVDMETAAIAAVCDRRQCPWSVFRAISDRADDDSTDPAVISLTGPRGEPRLGAVARFVLGNPKRVVRLYHLARGASLATGVAASAAVSALRTTYAS